MADGKKHDRTASLANLVSFADKPRDEHIAASVKGGKASGVARRRQRTFRESIKAIMALQTPDEEKRAKLVEAGIDPTVLNAINLAVSGKAAQGDVEAARYLRDTVGEKPREGLELGNLDDKPLASLDLSKLTDEQLQIIAARRAETSAEGEDDG